MNPVTELRYMESGLNALSGIRHTHDESCEILQVLSGTGSMIIGDRLYPLRRGALFLIPRMEFHSAVPDSGDYVRNILNLSERYLDSVVSLSGTGEQLGTLFGKQCLLPDENDFRAISELFQTFFLCLSSEDESSGFRQLSLTAELLYILSRAGLAPAAENTDSISRAVRYINDNLSGTLTLDGICASVHLSRYHFCRLFRKKTGMRPFDYILECRISAAKKKLADTDLPCSEIAELTGFGSFSSFSGAFRKKEGMTPSQYRASSAEARTLRKQNAKIPEKMKPEQS